MFDPKSFSSRPTLYIGFDSEFVEAMQSICRSITAAGYDPYSQLTGYLLTGNDAYITRSGNARAMIETLNRTQIQLYVNQQFHTYQ